MKKVILIIVLVLLSIGGYFFYTSVFGQVMFDTEAEYSEYSNGEKDVVFIGMHHVGRTEFYNDVKDKVVYFKNKGYVLYYEWIDFKAAQDSSMRKLRRIIGSIPDYDVFSNYFPENIITQDNELFLNQVNKLDYNVDYQVKDLIEIYETKYGRIIIDSIDFATPLDQPVYDSIAESHRLEIIHDARNELLFDSIVNSNHNKILVVYGADHEHGLREMLLKEKFEKTK